MKKKLFSEYEKENKIPEFDRTILSDDLVNSGYEVKKVKLARHKKAKKGLIISLSTFLAIFFIAPAAFVIAIGLHKTSHNSVIRKEFNLAERIEADTNSFKRLNTVTYPNGNKHNNSISLEYVNAINRFADNIYNLGREKNNFGFSPLSLYFHFDILSSLADSSFESAFDELLSANKNLRNNSYVNAYKNNFFTRDDNGMYIYNGFFLDDSYTLKSEYLTKLTNQYVEAFNLDLSKEEDVNKMINWQIEHSPFSSFDKRELALDEDSAFVLFTNQYFSNHWGTIFDSKDSYIDNFTDINGLSHSVTYLKHVIRTDYYISDKYISLFDSYSYQDGYSIQYISPINESDSIFDILTNINFVDVDKSKYTYGNIDLSLPKFTMENNIDLKNVLKDTEISAIYDKDNYVFNSAFNEDDVDPISLRYTKQKNVVTFNEDGTKVESVTFSIGASGAAPLPTEGYLVKLNSPFIFVIRDKYNLPIYVGQFAIPQ